LLRALSLPAFAAHCHFAVRAAPFSRGWRMRRGGGDTVSGRERELLAKQQQLGAGKGGKRACWTGSNRASGERLPRVRRLAALAGISAWAAGVTTSGAGYERAGDASAMKEKARGARAEGGEASGIKGAAAMIRRAGGRRALCLSAARLARIALRALLSALLACCHLLPSAALLRQRNGLRHKHASPVYFTRAAYWVDTGIAASRYALLHLSIAALPFYIGRISWLRRRSRQEETLPRAAWRRLLPGRVLRFAGIRNDLGEASGARRISRLARRRAA
jgi:hypothetical protein